MSIGATGGAGLGFEDPVHGAQATFRRIMSAMAQPGTISDLAPPLDAPVGLGPAMAAVALTLCDFETPLWLDEGLRASGPVVEYFRLHTGARICEATGDAAFALVSSWRQLPDFASFAQGTLEFPDASTTIVLEVEQLASSPGWILSGPGIAGGAFLDPGPMPPTFEAAMQANRQLHPRGVDLILCCGSKLAALPRSTRVEQGS